MKTLLVFFLLLSATFVMAQIKPVKIVFDVTSSDTLVHQAALRHVSSMAAAYPQSLFEVVIYGGALPMLMKDKSSVGKAMVKLQGNTNVSFKACQATMNRYHVEQSQLFSNVNVVPDAIIEIVTKQGEGWGYIKEAH